MAFVSEDRVMETATTTGTGAFFVLGAYTGYKAFSAVLSDSDTFYYSIEGIDGTGNPTGEWETGFGTYVTASNSFTRAVAKSSNSDSAVTFSAGTKRVMMAATAGFLSPLDDTVATTTIALAAGATDTMTVTITVKDAGGTAIDAVHALEVWISEAATGIGLTADSYSGDVTATTGTELQEVVSKKHYTYLTAATGILVMSAVDTANPADQYIVVKHPVSGKLTVSAASGTSWGA